VNGKLDADLWQENGHAKIEKSKYNQICYLFSKPKHVYQGLTRDDDNVSKHGLSLYRVRMSLSR